MKTALKGPRGGPLLPNPRSACYINKELERRKIDIGVIRFSASQREKTERHQPIQFQGGARHAGHRGNAQAGRRMQRTGANYASALQKI